MSDIPKCSMCRKTLDGNDDKRIIIHSVLPQKSGKNEHAADLIEYEIRYFHLCDLDDVARYSGKGKA